MPRLACMSATVLCLGAVAPTASSQEQAARRITITPECPAVPAGFAIDLVLHHPDVKWPSAVHCREDGSLLVAEDPMDMPGPSNQPLDRIWLLRFAADGSFTKTLFAEKLFAVMGLQEIDDAIYVMNMPHLTVLRDRDGDGVAEERRELITNLGPVAPGWPGGFNDHIVSGLRLGMDGFLYVSVGDKGVPGANGTDGSAIQLHGGGVVRVRPDGSQLEVVATGTRNHLDVAMNELDDLFTYDNTDDGLGWWTRFTHVMPTGYYGYPWDYHDHTDRMLPPMRDDGGGSGVGALVYREDAWPAEFQGDVFCCDWADRAVRHHKVERAGATYRCTLAEEFITAGKSGEFRPLDIAESADGRYLYIADWNHPGWMTPQVAGRVWRVRREDDRLGEPLRAGLPGTTVTELAAASDDVLVANLDHPAFRRRLAVQRELARRGDASLLLRVLHDEKSSDRTKRHTLWALDQGCPDLRGVAFATLLGSSNTELRIDATRALGEHRLGKAKLNGDLPMSVHPIVEQLGILVATDPCLDVRREAAIALGRIGDASALWPLVRALDTCDDLFVRFAIRQAIHVLPCDWRLLLQKLLPMASPRAQEDLWLALHELYDSSLAQELCAAVRYAFFTPAQRARALLVLGELHKKRPPWDGKWWQTQPAKSGWPAKTVAWDGTLFVEVAIDDAFHADEPELRAAAMEVVRITREPRFFHFAEEQLDATPDPLERVRLIELLAILDDHNAAPHFRRGLAHTDGRVRAAAATAFGRVFGADARADLRATKGDEDASVRNAALLELARFPDATDLDAYLRGLAIEIPRAACRSAIATLRDAVRPEIEARADRNELSSAALATLREIYFEPLPLLHWRLLGPFDRGIHLPTIEGAAPGTLDTTFSLPIASFAADPHTLAKSPTNDAAPPHGFVNLKALLTDQNSVTAYALALVDSPAARRARCAIGSDDGLTVWVNGVKVDENLGDRAWSPDQDRFEVALAAGRNEILLRIEQGSGDWSFNCKLSEPESGPLYASASAVIGADGTAAPFDLAKWRDFALTNHGDPTRGKERFYDEKGPGCFRCHAVAGVGPKVGPDLRDVGTKYPRAELITSLLEPSQRIQEGYTATNVFLKNGDVLAGLVTAEIDGVITLVEATGVSRALKLDEIRERRVSKLSGMPTGVAEQLTPPELADLVAWLETLKQ